MSIQSIAPHGGFAIVPPGKVLDFIDGVTLRQDTPEEYVRQEILKSLVREYGYDKADIRVEFPIKFGSRRVRVDIVVFPPGLKAAEQTQSTAWLIIECKNGKVRPSMKKDGVEQMLSYMAACPNVEVGMWTNGEDMSSYAFEVDSHGKRVEVEIPDIPHSGDTAEAGTPRFDQLRPAASDSLLFAFRRAHSYIAGNQGMQKPEAFWELLKLIFCKIQDERDSASPQFYATPKERQNMTGLMRCASRIGKLFETVLKQYPQIFKPTEQIELEPKVLAYIVTQLQMFSLLDSDVDVKGKAYEEIVGSNLRGDRGEFFTPRNVCNMMVNMLDPGDKDLILDPACGTGGFLIAAMNHVLASLKQEVRASGRSRQLQDETLRDRKKYFLENKLVGLDFNPNLVRATKMNMVMNNDGSGGLFQANSLDNPTRWTDDLRNRDLIGSVDVILTNPPFGSKIPIDEPAILEQFDLGHQWDYDEERDVWVKTTKTTSRPPEILFIERCIQLLKPGTGRAALVLPDGILGSPGLGFVRQWILTYATVLASIDLHPDTFQPGTSVQTSVLVLQRKSEQEVRDEIAAGRINDYDIFMAICDHIGHDKRGNSVYMRDDQGFEIVRETEDAVTTAADGDGEEQKHLAKERVVDDNTHEIAEEFRAWLRTL
ncbi:N-6 DNA methylase [Microbacterium sp. B35-04]|uniref:N-6 DNA methylase n=1 Tax=Microbacterium sp. B35-04 TaxID=1961716 RepID=UPI001953C5D3|nr:N-6 DNA methylase [Microbacterium sp. B35-04]